MTQRGMDNDHQVFFYEHDHYYLSNFSAFRVQWRGLSFDTSEAAYHWEKFPDHTLIRISIQQAPSAHEALQIAKNKIHLRRVDWDRVKVQIMRKILIAKLRQHEYIRRKLRETGNRILIENSWRDDFWGWGANHKGANMMGVLWMEIRREFINGLL